MGLCVFNKELEQVVEEEIYWQLLSCTDVLINLNYLWPRFIHLLTAIECCS